MTTRKDIIDRHAEVINLIKWFYSRKKWRYSQVRRRGHTSDFITDVFIRLLRTIPEGKEINCTLSTIVMMACKWELCHPQKDDVLNGSERMGRFTSALANDESEGDERYFELLKFIRKNLNKRHYYIFWHRFGIGGKKKEFREIAASMKVTKQRVHQLFDEVIERLRRLNFEEYVLNWKNEEVVKKPNTRRWKSDAAKALEEELFK